MYNNKISNQDLYEEILNINEKQEIMKQVFFTVNNLLNPQFIHLCSPLKNETYKLNIKGEFLIFSQILYKNYCPGKVIFLELLALDKIIIDEDLVSHDIKQIIIIAPIWEIVQQRIINLDGASEYQKLEVQRIYLKDYEERFDGTPGMEGKAGGTFLGIIDKIVRGENLLISCNGGRGGDGSDGLDGIQLIENSKNINVIHLGIGGKGGKGGNHGEIKFYFLNDSINLNIKKSTRNGVDGKSGINGIMQISHDFQSIYRMDYYIEHVKKLTSKRRIENFDLITNNFITTVTNYRKYVIDTTIKNGKIIHGNLYKKLNNVILLQNITAINFLQELIDIEYYYSMELNETVKNLLYTGILEGIAFYKRETIIDTEYRTLLSRLYDMTWRKVNEFDNPAIVNIQVYLEQSIENGEKLKNFQIRQKLQEIGNNFKAIFEEEIKEAEKLIDMNLKIYLDERINDLNDEIPKLINEIDEMITMKKGEIEKLRNIKKELNGKLILRSIFTIFQFLLLGLSFINPVCAAIAGVLSAGIVIADEIILDNDDDVIYNEIKLPEAVNEFVDTSILLYAELVQQELNIIQEQLNEIKTKKNELSLNDEEAKPLIDVDKSVNSQCIKNSRQPISRRQCMMKILKRKEIKWSKKDSDKKNRKYKKSLNIIKSSMGSLEIVNLSIDRFNKHFNDISSSNQIDGQIIEQENSIKQLENFKNNLYENFGNQIDRIRRDIRRNVDGYAISSRALLEYEKFQMHDFLNNILIKLNIWTKGFKDTASVPYEINYIKDKKLLQNVTKLEEIYTSNRIIEQFVDNVNVELVGEGQFMPADENICNNYFLDDYRNEMQFY
ncbi:uncharacterized protein LOC127283038 [Leptopilina boulardi]|uniref:uncharacterized protein LOC127283038 n=1 Tax=Leptopilina boulardi TaxID=63433 RepID=UPI0021F60712|nr:uncharacterized protein LOC127283038 [Leptopilina boulardi]